MQAARDQGGKATQSDVQSEFIRSIHLSALWKLMRKSTEDWYHCIPYWDPCDCRSGLAAGKERYA